MDNIETIKDRIKGGLYCMALSDALRTISSPKINFPSEGIDKERYMKRLEKNDNAEKEEEFVVSGFNDDPSRLIAPSANMQAFMRCLYELINWKEDLLNNQKWIEPSAYISKAVGSDVWEKEYDFDDTPPFWISSAAVGLTGHWLFNYSHEPYRDIIAAVHPKQQGIFRTQQIPYQCCCSFNSVSASLLRNLLVHNYHVNEQRFKLLLYESTTRVESCGVQCNYLYDDFCNSHGVGDYFAYFLKNTAWPDIPLLILRLKYKMLYYNHKERNRIFYSIVLGVINGYESFPLKYMMKHVAIVKDIDDFLIVFEKKLLKAK